MSNFSSLSHSYNVDLCCQYGIEEAVLIHHFQYWIRHNMNLKRNFHDGRTWSFQTHAEISAHFPYWTPDKIRRYLDSLVEKGIIIKGNFNKTPFDRTIWYAFSDEEKFLSNGNSNIPNERLIRQIQPADEPNPNVQSARPIPDTKTDTKKNLSPTSQKPESENSKSEKILAIAKRMTTSLVVAITKTKKDFIFHDLNKWTMEFKEIIEKDKRSISSIEKILEWFPSDGFWSKRIWSANGIRKNFDQLEISYQSYFAIPHENHIELINRVKNIPNLPKDEIIFGHDYIEFPNISDGYFKASDAYFRKKVFERLSKMCVDIQGL